MQLEPKLKAFIENLILRKKEEGLTWQDIADTLSSTGFSRSEAFYRRYAAKMSEELNRQSVAEEPTEEEVVDEELSDAEILQEQVRYLQSLKVQVSDERNQLRAYIRKDARDKAVLEAIRDAAKELAPIKITPPLISKRGENEGLLLLSDWHYGIEIDSYWNAFNPEIAEKRVANLVAQVLDKIQRNHITRLHIFNLADLIAGRIHLAIRLESRLDVISQIMRVSEILAHAISVLACHAEIDYYECTDNHSRLEPRKDDSLEEESLCRITSWYLKERLRGVEGVSFHENDYGRDIIATKILGHNVAGVHGDKDRQDHVIDTITLMTEQHYDLICTAHLHHFSADEKNRTILVSNGSLMGTDSFAQKLRLSATPSQTLIVISPENVTEAIYRLKVD